jgi:ribulose 1,5-bisphosphate carboxylase large subunit-like protein
LSLLNLDDFIFNDSISSKDHIIATYYVESPKFLAAAKAIATGQSIGNPEVRNSKESSAMLQNHLGKILDSKANLPTGKHGGIVQIGYPLANYDPEHDGLGHMMCTLMGGQMDIDIVEKCHLLDVEFPEDYLKHFKGPKFGMDYIKKMALAENRPLLGGIIKPKTGMTAKQVADSCYEMMLGGVDFIKEDEILGNPRFCDFEDRIRLTAEKVDQYKQETGKQVFFITNVNAKYSQVLDRVRKAHELGAQGVHINVWNGWPEVYDAIRQLDLPIALHFQKSGDRVFTNDAHNYHISWPVVCKLARMSGADFIHAGMWGGYLSDSKERLNAVFDALTGDGVNYKKTTPSLSCGSHPGIVETTVKNFGKDVMMSLGGAMHGHPMGTIAGAMAMRQAFDHLDSGVDIVEYMKDKPELKAAIEKWGYVKP